MQQKPLLNPAALFHLLVLASCCRVHEQTNYSQCNRRLLFVFEFSKTVSAHCCLFERTDAVCLQNNDISHLEKNGGCHRASDRFVTLGLDKRRHKR